MGLGSLDGSSYRSRHTSESGTVYNVPTRAESLSDAPDVVYLGAEDLFQGVFSRSQALALQLARSCRVLYPKLDLCSIPHYVFDRLFRRSIPHSPDPYQVLPNLWSLDFITPVPHRLFKAAISRDGLLAANNALNLWAMARQLRQAIRKLDFRNYLLWLGTPWMAPMVKHLRASKVCYDYMDDIPGFFQGRTRQRATQHENLLLRRCDFVIVTSEALHEKASKFNQHVHVVRNGVAIDHYTEQDRTCPAELQSLPRPILGYVGSVGSWFDVELAVQLAATYRQGSLVIVGGLVRTSAPELLRLPNVHLLGWKPHREIPRYLGAFDVCLIPFQIIDLTRAVNPIKFYEHCAAGKPTVSVRLPELEGYRDICYLAGSREEFVRAVDAALQEAQEPERAADLAHRRRALAEENSWDARGKEIEAILGSECTP
jgi:glycosyltransferase involved in cell wall biosynthesis